MKPTDEQIKALRKGDVVTVRARIEEPPTCGGKIALMTFVGGDKAPFRYVSSYDIMTIEPREIKEGDRVEKGGYRGEVKAVCGEEAWVRYDCASGGPVDPFMLSEKSAHLTVIP